MNTVEQWLAQAIAKLRLSADTDTPELDAQLLVCHCLGLSRTQLYAFPETSIKADERKILDAALARRLDAEPIAYITGRREFWSADLQVCAQTLVPRADTEILVEKALELASQSPDGSIIDLGTGTGAIAIAVASELPDRQLVAIECDAQATTIANANIKAYAADNVQLLRASWLDAIGDNQAAMVLSNPPYLANDDPHLAKLKHEPLNALVSGPTGLEDLEHIIAETVRAAKPGAPLIMEHGNLQGGSVRQLLLDYSYASVGTGMDLAGHERISFGFVTKRSL